MLSVFPPGKPAGGELLAVELMPVTKNCRLQFDPPGPVQVPLPAVCMRVLLMELTAITDALSCSDVAATLVKALTMSDFPVVAVECALKVLPIGMSKAVIE